MASPGRIGRAEDGTRPPRYVASLLWPAHLPHSANDNRQPWTLASALSLALSAALLAAALWAVVA